MATNSIGRAVIVIEADATKFTGDLDRQLGAEGAKAGDKAGKQTGWTFMRGVASNVVAAGVTRAAAGIGNLFSSAFTAGMGRLVAIDDARGSLRGLGHDAESIDRIMSSALASVKGTAFGLGDAATLAATAVASGIKPGEELTQRLKLTGDAATIARTSLSEMGSIFGKVQTGQRAYTAELNQLADRGIPIYEWLQEELGVSAEALRKMVSQGEVDSATFFRVIDKNIGGAALEAGQTFSGSLQNVGAAIGRLGAAFLEPVFQQMPSVFGRIITGLDGIAPAATAVGAAVGAAFTGLVDVLGTVAGFIQDHPVLFGILGAAVLGAATAFTVYTVALKAWWVITIGIPKALAAARVAVIAFNAALRANPIGLIVTAIGALVGALVWLWNNNETFRRVVTAAWEGVKTAVSTVVDWFTGTVVPFFQGLWQTLSGGDGPNIFMRAWEGIKGFFAGLWDGIVAGVTWFINFVTGLFFRFHPLGLVITHWSTIVSFFQGLWASVVGIFQGVVDWVVGTFGPAFSVVGRLIALPFELGYKIMQAIAILIVRGLMGLVDFAAGVFAAGWGLLRTYIVQPVADGLARLLPVWNAIVAGFVWVRDLVVAAVTWLADKAIAAWTWLSTRVTAIVTAIVAWAVNKFIWWRDTLTGIVDLIRDWVTARWDTLKQNVTGLIAALVTWAVTRWTTFRDNIVNLADLLRQWVTEKFDDLKTKAEEIFQNMVDGIGRIWDGLKEIAKAPVKFVIETVLNDGLISGWNWVVDKLKLPDNLRIADIPLPEGFWSGGVLPGPGTGSGDDMLVVDRHGRGVATVASGEPVLSRAMYSANKPVVDAILAGQRIPGFFQGGVLPTPGPVRPHKMPYYNARYAADMGLGTGSPVYAWNPGTVAQTMLAATSYGNRIRLNHEAGLGQTLYAHLSRILVSVGQAVQAGQKIGEVGYSGNVRPPGPGGAHLHFEILGGNAPIGPSDTGGGGLLGAAVGWITDRLTAPVRAAIDRLPGDSFITDAAKGAANKLLDNAVTKLTGLIPGDTGTPDVGFVPGTAGSVPGLAGVTPNTYAKAANIYAAATAAGHRVSTVGGYRGDGEHVTRRALDFMVGKQAAGDYIAAYVLGNKSRFGLQHVIWWQRINSGDARGWRQMANRGSWTQNHMDHPHVLFNSSDKVMDSGGWLPHGGRAVNTSGRAEPVLTAGQWDNVQGILSLLERQQDREKTSKGAQINVTYAPVIDPHAVNPQREYERFTHSFVADVEALLR